MSLAKISNPVLIITGTDDIVVPTQNSLVIAGKIPGAWLIQIKDDGHSVIGHYPDEINKILQTFLSTTNSTSRGVLIQLDEWTENCIDGSSFRYAKAIDT